MSDITFAEFEHSVLEEYLEEKKKQKRPDYGITADQAVDQLRAVMPGYATLIKPDSKIDSSTFVDISTTMRCTENFFWDEAGSAEDIVKTFAKSERVWKDLGDQLDQYIRNHPVMQTENPPGAGVIGVVALVPKFAMGLGGETYHSMIKCSLSVMVKVYFQP